MYVEAGIRRTLGTNMQHLSPAILPPVFASSTEVGTRQERGTCPALLLIDDEIRDDDPLVRWLTLEGFALECAQTGVEGLARGMAARHDVLVLDLHLPDMLGLTVLSELKRANLDTPVVVMTGWYLDTNHEEAARALGAAAFVRKPLDGPSLGALVHSVVSAPPLRAQTQSCSTMMNRSAPSRRSRPHDDAAERDALRDLHTRLVNGDEAAMENLFAIMVPRVRRALSARFHRVPDEWTHDAVVDALLDYYRSPERFDPCRGVPLTKWIEYPARRNLLNRLDLERRRSDHETKISDRDLEGQPVPSSDVSGHSDLESWLRSVIPMCSAVERAVLRLWMSGERRAFAFADATGIAGIAPREQRTAVKRVKDRLLRRIRRQLIRSNNRVNS